MARVLVISPHPDDESIGCGGTLWQHRRNGDRVEVVFLTSGEKGGHGRSVSETIRIREAEAHRASKILKLNRVELWRLPDGELKATAGAVARLSKKLASLKPTVVYLPHDGEMHPDHRAAVRMLKLALKRSKQKPDVLMFEVWTPLGRMDHIVDISKEIETKMRAIRAYKCQNAEVAFDEAFRGLARYRGEMHSWPGGDYAEVFARLKP